MTGGVRPVRVARQVALGEQVTRALRTDILTRTIQPGVLLVEATLAGQFGVSRGPVRDALRTLAAEGLIVSAGRSYRVVGLDAQDVRELFALRRVLEVFACTEAATGDPEACRLAAAAALAEMRIANRARDTYAFAEADVTFHTAFYQASGNSRLLAVWEQHVPTLTVLFQTTNALDTTLSGSVERHRQLLDTVLRGDPAEIADAVGRHLSEGLDRIMAAYRKAAQPPPEPADARLLGLGH